ncbi:MAG: hypothetical protein ACRD4E_03730 [Bryobacteraceae bacterium]
MTAAGVQTNDSAAYLPPPPSTSTPDAKGASGAGKPGTDVSASDAPGATSDFQSELQLHQSGQQDSKPADRVASTRTGDAKTGSGKTGKKRDARTDNANPSTVTPVPVADSQKPILPFSLALPQPQDNLAQQQDQNAKADDKATPDENAQKAAQSPAPVLSPSLASVAQFPDLQHFAKVNESMKAPRSAQTEAPSSQPASSNPISAAGTDPGKTPVLPFAPVPAAAQDTPVVQEEKKSEDPASQDRATALTLPGASSNRSPVSPADLKLSATSAEPVAPAVQEKLDRTSSGPSALAFAARIAAAQQKSDQPVDARPSPSAAQSSAVSGSQTAVEIPVRYAATAQIIQSAALGTKPETQEDGPKKDVAPSIDTPARGARTDMVLPQFETVSQSAGNSGSTAPQQTAPPVRAESVIEPPAAPPTSSHDIRVRVPDNSGGSTQLRFVESGGEVRISVHTADESLAQNLRTHLNDLTQRLSDGGLPAEIWKPAASATSSQNDSQRQFQQDGRGSGGQGSGGQSGQQDRQQQRPAWLEEMEASLHGDQG